MFDRCDGGDRAPAGPSIGGIKGTYSRLVGIINGHNNGAIWTHNGLSADDSGIIGRRGTPMLTTISRSAHLEKVAGCMIIPLCVTVAVEGTCRRIVTNNPVLIQVAAGRKSPRSLYDPKIATMEGDKSSYDQTDATGFIQLTALRLKLRALRDQSG